MRACPCLLLCALMLGGMFVRACTCLLLCALIFVSAWACMHYKSLDDGPCISYHSDSNNVTSTLA